MLCIIDKTTDPYWNLAAEEYLLKSCSESIFRLWRNAPSIIVGRYQNALAEVNAEYVREHDIPVVRRLTGGGAVFHDLGNINFTFIDNRREGEDTAAMFARFTAPIVEALRSLGVNACLSGRNDLVIDGLKFSGNAICLHNDRVLQHGTLLFSSSMNSLADALRTRPEKFIGKSVQSNRSRVTNISGHLPADHQMDVEGFMEFLKGYIVGTQGADICQYTYTEEDMRAIEYLCSTRYMTGQWNFGQSPKYTFSNTFRLPCGLFDINLQIQEGVIADCHIQGDYFFLRPTEDITTALRGIPHNYEAILSVLSKFPMREYFGANISGELAAGML